MLNRQSSSSSSSTKRKSEKQKREKSPFNPLRDLNGIDGSYCGSSSISSSSSSSMSIEATRGCFRFFTSNSSASKTPLHKPKSFSKKTPKSAPIGKQPSNPSSSSRSNKPLKENVPKPTSEMEKPNKKKNPPCLYQWQYGKKPISKTAQTPKPTTGFGTGGCLAHNLAFGSEDFTQRQCTVKMADESGDPPNLLKLPDLIIGDVENSTPIGKLGCGFDAKYVQEDPTTTTNVVNKTKFNDLGNVVESSTPVGKLECGSGLGCEFGDNYVDEDSTTKAGVKTRTPTVQASVSPEILGGSSMTVSAATPACYGAGHIISGVSDRRKCRAKGILTVGETDSNCGKGNIFDNSDDVEIINKSRASLVPLPVEASMCWLLFPREEEGEDQKNDLENVLRCVHKSLGSATLNSVSSPSSGSGIPLDLCHNKENSRAASSTSRRGTRITVLSPSGNPTYQALSGASSGQMAVFSSSVSPHATPNCEEVILQDKRKQRYDIAGENSPLSIDSLGSENVIQTPHSDLSSDRHVGLSSLNAHDHEKHGFGSEIGALEEVLLRVSLSTHTEISARDSPGLNFQFSDLISPSNSIDFTKLPNTWDNGASSSSDTTLDTMSRSQIRISWRDGLVSRIFEMDEFDCCRCLSDDENDANECSDGKFKASPSLELNVDVENAAIFTNGFGSPEVVGHEPKSDGEAKEQLPLQSSNPCAESICADADGGGLVASSDSDWTVCYKNQLFDL